MSQIPHGFGIAGFGYAFGADQNVEEVAGAYVPDPDRIFQWGYRTFHRAPDEVTATDLAAQAARDALARTSLAVDDVDLLVLATSEHPEYLHWDGSAALGRALGMDYGQTLLLNEGCASGVTGLGLVAGTLAIQPETSTVLFVAVNRVSEFHRNRMTVNNAVHSDGAVAAVLRRGHERNTWLATDQFTVPDLCDWFRTDYGGSVAPLPPEGWSSRTAPPGHVRVQEHFRKEPAKLREFGEAAVTRIVDVVDGACKRAGVGRDEVTHLIYINDPDGIADLAGPLGLPLERTSFELAKDHGHMGSADQLTALGELTAKGVVAPGDLVALTGISIGMRWYCTLVRA
ncbi:3-oxoacyl-[acyl-carrier-protein] synthase III C-terminal domain-containing protein [Streptomyces albidoflavus]|uniref:3-oxoacyl-[acyl-carrier-protein] synthase III C-terminal domain-containing protein n=1 Tax=Streptomyces albidoflavus TaxID=1886 RepID=UPI003664873A